MLELIFCIIVLLVVSIILQPVEAFEVAISILVLWAIIEVIRWIRRH